MTWKLKRLRQCAKCPWKVTTDPHDIPRGYSEELHRALAGTVATPGAISVGPLRVMACHEHDSEEGVHCVGWLMNQLGPGNNIGLRLSVRDCDNIGGVRLVGEQHRTFEDTLP